MPTYKYVGNSDFYLRGGEKVLGPDEEVELSEETAEKFGDCFERVEEESASEEPQANSDEEEDDSPSEEEESAENESEADEGEAEPPLDPTERTIPQLESELEAVDFSDAELDALEMAEEDGEDRNGALDAIESAR